jgi:hypothetical protein
LGCGFDGAKAADWRDWRLGPAGSLLAVEFWAEAAAVMILAGGRAAVFLKVMRHSTSSPAKTIEFLNWMDARMFEGRLIIRCGRDLMMAGLSWARRADLLRPKKPFADGIKSVFARFLCCLRRLRHAVCTV